MYLLVTSALSLLFVSPALSQSKCDTVNHGVIACIMSENDKFLILGLTAKGKDNFKNNTMPFCRSYGVENNKIKDTLDALGRKSREYDMSSVDVQSQWLGNSKQVNCIYTFYKK